MLDQENTPLRPEETEIPPGAAARGRWRHGDRGRHPLPQQHKVYFFDPGELTLKPGDHVIIDTAGGWSTASAPPKPHCAPPGHRAAPPQVVRLATEKDERINAENEQKEKRATRSACKKSATTAWTCSWCRRSALRRQQDPLLLHRRRASGLPGAGEKPRPRCSAPALSSGRSA